MPYSLPKISCKLRSALAALATALALLPTRAARADDATVVAVDLDWTGGSVERGVDGGQGVALRVGRKLDLTLASLTPEIGGGYHAFRGTGEAHLKQGFVGGRLRLGKVIEPGVYAHIGYGWLDVNGAMAGSDGISGVSADAGASLDLTILPMLDLGIHAGYNGILANGDHAAFDTFVLGVNAGLVF